MSIQDKITDYKKKQNPQNVIQMSATRRVVFKSKGIMFHDMLLIFCFMLLISYQIAYTRPINEITETTNAPETQETNNALNPTETQKAVCTVTSGDVRASAEAFTTRELKGVCGSIEMLTGFNDLELRLSKELHDLKNLINYLAPAFSKSDKEKAFKIKAHFQHLHRDFLYLQLEDYSSSAQLSLGNSIILDTGGIFKEINSQKFKYKISILDQNKKRSSDLVSQEFDNHDNGFLIPNSALIESPFIKDDSLLVQIS
ncbi:hypothetical protein DOY81_011464, partial [Sarcophaga bullata]